MVRVRDFKRVIKIPNDYAEKAVNMFFGTLLFVVFVLGTIPLHSPTTQNTEVASSPIIVSYQTVKVDGLRGAQSDFFYVVLKDIMQAPSKLVSQTRHLIASVGAALIPGI